jgi:hypothetical protein
MKVSINPYGVVGFGLAAAFAVIQEWSLPEFCWSAWFTGLVYSWICLVTASMQIILTARSDKGEYEKRIPWLRRCSGGLFLAGMTVVSVSVGALAFRFYCIIFGFYGLFLSVFSEMEPLAVFGRNGFINSDFITPVAILAGRFWPMALGVVIANWKDFVRGNPWQRAVLPFQWEILRMHVMILALPFFSLIAWALCGNAYPSMTIVLLMALFYLLPKKDPAHDAATQVQADQGVPTVP